MVCLSKVLYLYFAYFDIRFCIYHGKLCPWPWGVSKTIARLRRCVVLKCYCQFVAFTWAQQTPCLIFLLLYLKYQLSSTKTPCLTVHFLTILSEISMLLPDCGIQQNSASKSYLHLGNDIFAFKYYARVGILWQKSAQHWQFTPTMGRTVDVNRHHMLVEQWTAHSQHRTAPPLVNVSLPCQLRDPTPQELWHKKWERGGDRVRFCSDSSSTLKLGAEIKSVVQTPTPPNQFIIGCLCTSSIYLYLNWSHSTGILKRG